MLAVLWAGAASAAAAADLTLSVAPRWRGQPLAVPSAVVANAAGQSLRVTRLALLLSEVELQRADGSRVRLEGQYGYIDAGSGRREFMVRGVPAGEFVGLEFAVGVPANVNHADPARWPAGHALHPLLNGLHWGWQGGYVFAAIEGRWREAEAVPAAAPATAALSAEAGGEDGFSYHLATDARRMTVRFAAAFSVRADTRIELALDLGRVLAAMRLNAEDGSASTHSVAGDPVAAALGAAIERAWFWLGSGPAAAPGAAAGAAAGGAAGGTGTPYAFTTPAGFPRPALPADNPLTVEGVALGERLFFDPRLSARAAQSCASCHEPARAFSDGVALSAGAEGTPGIRNAMPLVNLAWHPSYAWDGGQARVRDQAFAAWTNPIEMNAVPGRVVEALSADPRCIEAFRAAFGTAAITPERIILALEQYLLTLTSADSRFDRALRGEVTFTAEEKRGFELFATEYDPARGRRGADCFHCHGGALFSDFAFRNNGLPGVGADAGRAGVTHTDADRGKFKTPSLRNVDVTAPYLHDGRFATLAEVVAHYDHGVQRSATLDPNLAKHPANRLALTPNDQRALVAFLRTLTDARFLVAKAPSGGEP